MHSSTLLKLCLLLTSCQPVSSSQSLLSQNDTLSMEKNSEKILEKFFVDLNKGYLEKHKHRHITIVGASASEFQQTETLFENYPYMICEKAEGCATLPEFFQGNFVIMFLDYLSGETIDKNFTILSECRKCDFLFIFDETIQFDRAWSMVSAAMRTNVRYARFAHRKKNAIDLYSDFIGTNCSKDVRLVTVWKPGSSLNKINTWAPQSYDLNGCPVSICTSNLVPKMIIKENDNGSLSIAGGLEGELLMALASKLNFTIKIRYPSPDFQMKYSRKIAMIYDAIYQRSELAIGRLRPDGVGLPTMANSYPYDEECVTWAVPRVMEWSKNIVLIEFSSEVWASVGLVFTVGCIIKHANKKTVPTKKNGERNSGFVLIVMNTVALHVGLPVMNESSSAGGKFMLVIYLYYAMVVSTAYKTSLASILAAEDGTPTIVDVAGIIKANLNVGGTLFDHTILANQVNDSEHHSKLLERFVINNNQSGSWNYLFSGKDQAILGRRSLLNRERQSLLKAHDSVTYNILKGCVLPYPTVIYYRTRLFAPERLDSIIKQVLESGITAYWDVKELDADTLLHQRTMETYLENRATDKFQTIFIYYLYCIFISLFTFFIELLASKLRSEERSRVH